MTIIYKPHAGKVYWLSSSLFRRALVHVTKVTQKWIYGRLVVAVQESDEQGNPRWVAGDGDEIDSIPRAFHHSIEQATAEDIRGHIAALANEQRLAKAQPGDTVEAVGRCDVADNPAKLSRIGRKVPIRDATPAVIPSVTDNQPGQDATMNTLMVALERETFDKLTELGDQLADGVLCPLQWLFDAFEGWYPQVGIRAILRCLQNKKLLRAHPNNEYTIDLPHVMHAFIPADAIAAVDAMDSLMHAAPAADPVQPVNVPATPDGKGKRPPQPVEFLNHVHCGVTARIFIRVAHSLGVTSADILAYLKANGPEPSARWVANEIWKFKAGRTSIPTGTDTAPIAAALGVTEPVA